MYLNASLVHQDTSNVVGMGGNPQVGASDIGVFNGHIAELIDLNAAPTTTERQQIEGYLAHKFAQTALLPGGHPYKSAPPMT